MKDEWTETPRSIKKRTWKERKLMLRHLGMALGIALVFYLIFGASVFDKVQSEDAKELYREAADLDPERANYCAEMVYSEQWSIERGNYCLNEIIDERGVLN